MKAGEGNPQAWEEEGKLYSLSKERSSSLAGIPRMWDQNSMGKPPLSLDRCRFRRKHVWGAEVGCFFQGVGHFFQGDVLTQSLKDRYF